MDFGKKLRELRLAKGETQLQLAKSVGTLDRSVRRWEAGSVYPTAETVIKIAQHFNVSTDYLLDVAPTVKTVATAFKALPQDQQKELLDQLNGTDK